MTVTHVAAKFRVLAQVWQSDINLILSVNIEFVYRSIDSDENVNAVQTSRILSTTFSSHIRRIKISRIRTTSVYM